MGRMFGPKTWDRIVEFLDHEGKSVTVGLWAVMVPFVIIYSINYAWVFIRWKMGKKFGSKR